MEELHPYLTAENGFLFRITHESNLPFILRHGLLCPNHPTQDASFRAIANQDVDEKRESCRVPIQPGGVLHDYVPFYFAPRSPMLYWNYEQAHCPQEEILYLGSKVSSIAEAGLPFVFTSGHAIMHFSTWHSRVEDLAQAIDWPLMRGKYWNNVSSDTDRKRRRMAEFLVHRQVPLTVIGAIAVKTAEKRLRLRHLSATMISSPPL
jgi:hypothetical protein